MSIHQEALDTNLFIDDDSVDVDNEETLASVKDSKHKRKRNKKKKAPKVAAVVANNVDESNKENADQDEQMISEEIEIELVPEEVELGQNYAEFAKVFDHFKFNDAEVKEAPKEEPSSKMTAIERLKARMFEDEEEDEKEKEEADTPKMSKKKMKKLTRLSVAALKQLVNRPDVVEMHDVTARDPKLLVQLKATRNTVVVPRHWCAKRKYLQGKRGFEKPAFDLPDFIKRTGIQGMREALDEKEQNKSLKQKMREKVRPKMGKIDIDYQKLHDAFFRYQTKPYMGIHGDLYYEGKELETRLKEKKPGNITDDLRIALGMPTGSQCEKIPPPWLIAMQRYGPPPSYPSLKIAGLNAPIPDGCSFGYHAGGWGKPPVDEFGRPLYGDVFGSSHTDLRKPEEEEPVDKSLWGEMEDEIFEEVEPEEDSEEEEETEEQEEQMSEETKPNQEDMAGLKTPGEGLMTPSGISTAGAGLETPDMIELRKRKTQIESDMESVGGAETPALYKILPEKAAHVGASMMGSSKVYDISHAKKAALLQEAMISGIGSQSGSIDMTLIPEELDMDTDQLQSRLDQQIDASLQSDKSKKKAPKAQKAPTPAGGTSSNADKDKNKKYKEFKF